MAAVNISCGYYEPHSKNETINVTELNNAIDFCVAVSERLEGKYPHEVPKYCPPTLPIKSLITSGLDSQKECLECGKSLYNYKSVACDACLVKAFGGERMCKNCLGANYASGEIYCWICRNKSQGCRQCKTILFTQKEKDLGLCGYCGKTACYTCDNELLTSDEIRSGVCNKCFFKCNCGKTLSGYSENWTGLCADCSGTKDYCDCKEELTLSYEKSAGQCIKCAARSGV